MSDITSDITRDDRTPTPNDIVTIQAFDLNDPDRGRPTTMLARIQMKGRAAQLVFDEFEDFDRTTIEGRPIARRALLDLNDVKKLAHLYADGNIPRLSRPDTLNTLVFMGLLRPSVDRSYAHLNRGHNPTLDALFMFGKAYATMYRMQHGRPAKNEAIISAKLFTLYRDVLSEASMDTRVFVEKMIPKNSRDLFVTNGLLTTKNFPTIELQYLMAYSTWTERMTTRRHLNAYASRPASESDYLFAENELLEAVVVRRPREFWLTHHDELAELPTYTRHGEGVHVSELSNDLFASIEFFSRLGLVFLKDGTFVYASPLLGEVLRITSSDSMANLAYG